MRDSDMVDELVMSRLRKRADSLTQREVAQSATELRSHAFSILAGLQPMSSQHFAGFSSDFLKGSEHIFSS